jgi:hypothetical protein
MWQRIHDASLALCRTAGSASIVSLPAIGGSGTRTNSNGLSPPNIRIDASPGVW